MGSIFINGSNYSISTALGTAKTVTGIDNSDPAVAQSATPPTNGDIAVIHSGWDALDDTVARVAGATTTDFELEGVDTTNTTKYPVGEGAGTVQVASGFVPLSQIRGIESSGGEQQFFEYQYVGDLTGRQRKKPSFKNAITWAFTLDYDPDLPWYQALIDLDEAREAAVIKQILPNGALILAYGYPSFNKVPNGTSNENMTVEATFSLLSDPIRYASV